MEMAVDCLAGALFSAKLDNEDIPIPSKLEEIDPTHVASEFSNSNLNNLFVTLVSVDVEEYAKTHFNKAIKITLTIPEWLNKRSYEQKNQFFASPSRSIDCQIAFVVNYKLVEYYIINKPHTFYRYGIFNYSFFPGLQIMILPTSSNS